MPRDLGLRLAVQRHLDVDKSPILTLCCLSRRKLASHFMRHGICFSFPYLLNRMLWTIFSKVLVKSMKIALTTLPRSSALDQLWTSSTSILAVKNWSRSTLSPISSRSHFVTKRSSSFASRGRGGGVELLAVCLSPSISGIFLWQKHMLANFYNGGLCYYLMPMMWMVGLRVVATTWTHVRAQRCCATTTIAAYALRQRVQLLVRLAGTTGNMIVCELVMIKSERESEICVPDEKSMQDLSQVIFITSCIILINICLDIKGCL